MFNFFEPGGENPGERGGLGKRGGDVFEGRRG